MSLEILKYKSVDNTVQNMYALVNEFKDAPEMRVFSNWSLKKIFNYISKTIPYVPDPVPGQVAYLKGDAVELLKSPIQTMHNGGDCDDKSILAACIFEVKHIPYRFVVVSTRPDKSLHHVYLEINYGGRWVPFDATYNYYQIFWENPFTKKKRYEFMNNSLIISDVPPTSTKCQSCLKPCSSAIQSKNYLNKKSYPAQMLGSNGNAHTNIGGVQLAILRGAGESIGACSCNCKPNSKKRKPVKRSFRDKQIINSGVKSLLGNAIGLGDPITVVSTVVSFVGSLFGGLFKKEAYQDAYNAWMQAVNMGDAATVEAAKVDPAALDRLTVARSIIAVLSRDYMNPPLGADVCTSSGRCGNRAEWSKIQPEVEAKAAALAPFMLYLNKQHLATNGNPPMRLEDLVSYYDMFKNKSGLYTQFASSQTSGSNKNNKKDNPNKLQFSGAGLLLLAGAAAVAFSLKGKHK